MLLLIQKAALRHPSKGDQKLLGLRPQERKKKPSPIDSTSKRTKNSVGETHA